MHTKHLNEYAGSMKVTKQVSKLKVDGNWVSFYYKGFKIVAKIFATPSEYGINEGRVSKLNILTSEQVGIYNYDRGFDFDNAPTGLVDEILSLFES